MIIPNMIIVLEIVVDVYIWFGYTVIKPNKLKILKFDSLY